MDEKIFESVKKTPFLFNCNLNHKLEDFRRLYKKNFIIQKFVIIILLKKIKVLKFNIVLNLYYKRIDTSVNNPLAYNIKFE